MFTGIVEELGRVVSLEGDRLRIGDACGVLQDATLGASIAVNGCCLTVVDFDSEEGWWDAEISQETFDRTSLGGLKAGDVINLERPVRVSDRLGGHVVQGHVDGVGEVTEAAPEMVVSFDPELSKYVVEKGSITIDGVSLTVVDAPDGGASVALIPHTCEVTNLGRLTVGSKVNIEVDVNAKYVERLVAAHIDSLTSAIKAGLDEERAN